MPEAILKFNLPEEQSEFEDTVNAGKYYSVLWDLDQFLRNKTKYATDDVTKEEINACYALRDELWRLLGEHNLDLNK
jgi:hypothetical protein